MMKLHLSSCFPVWDPATRKVFWTHEFGFLPAHAVVAVNPAAAHPVACNGVHVKLLAPPPREKSPVRLMLRAKVLHVRTAPGAQKRRGRVCLVTRGVGAVLRLCVFSTRVTRGPREARGVETCGGGRVLGVKLNKVPALLLEKGHLFRRARVRVVHFEIKRLVSPPREYVNEVLSHALLLLGYRTIATLEHHTCTGARGTRCVNGERGAGDVVADPQLACHVLGTLPTTTRARRAGL